LIYENKRKDAAQQPDAENQESGSETQLTAYDRRKGSMNRKQSSAIVARNYNKMLKTEKDRKRNLVK
jgi:hypothetical protein